MFTFEIQNYQPLRAALKMRDWDEIQKKKKTKFKIQNTKCEMPVLIE